MIGFAVALAALVFYALFTGRQVANLRKLQANTVERNRRDTLQLVRIQDALYSLEFAFHDVLEDEYSVTSFEPQIQRLLLQLKYALRKERELAPHPEERADQERVAESLQAFERATKTMFDLARAGDEKKARELIIGTLRPQRDALSAAISHMLTENNELDEQTEIAITRIYNRVDRDLYTFLLASIAAIILTAISVAATNRRFFVHLKDLSDQKSTLARKLISVQEEVLRSVSRELHDEFGQILTAVGAMLTRLNRKHTISDPGLKEDLSEVREATQEALEKVRSLSQMLHPAVIDDYGLEKAIEWYVPMFEKQTGIPVAYRRSGGGSAVGEETAIHVYRILQEALSNVARHSGAKEATVQVHYAPDKLVLQVEDQGVGLGAANGKGRRGLGLVAMRERAELVHGRLRVEPGTEGGTRVSLEVPLNDGPSNHASRNHVS